MSAPTTSRPEAATPPPEPRKRLGEQAVRIMTTTDHKLIGKMYMGMAFAFFCFGGVLALMGLIGAAFGIATLWK